MTGKTAGKEAGKAGGLLLGGLAAAAVIGAGGIWWVLGSGAPQPVATEPSPQAQPQAAAVPEPAAAPEAVAASEPAASKPETPKPAAPEAVAAPKPADVPAPVLPAAPVAAAPEPSAAPVPAIPEAVPAAPAQAVASQAPEPAQAEPAKPEPAKAAAVPVAAPVARYDTLRVTPEGAMTIAGAVAPGAKVEILLDGQVIDTVTANAAGAFASVSTVAPSAEARRLGLRVTGSDGVAQSVAETLTVAPSPLALAQAATAAGAPPEAVAAKVAAAQVLADTPLVTDETGSARVLAGASAALVIDTLSFAADGGMAISGRGAPAGAVLRAYVDSAEVGLVRPDAQGTWAMHLPAAAPGPHALRVDALDASGKVLSRAEQGFEGVAPKLLAASAQVQDQAQGLAPTKAQPRPLARAITITRGNTLWAIAREAYGDPYLYVQIFQANRDQIRDPDRIYPGQVFTLPR